MAPTTGSQAQRGDGASSNGLDAPVPQELPSPSPSSSSVGDSLAQALRDLARGEQTASTLEANLTSLENKLDEILAALGVSAADLDALGEQEKEPRAGQQRENEKGASKGSGESA
ncbi:uncharacterized protein P884DRAFT_289793 [Thermothelomyces heterothallicus CBS 202.75]|uniref:uncharacterized protein n=1 Tax=Thermothelomyces heterothallicus CBS 202.75 TaxID=1149848 RepID=UPI00374231BA